MPRLDLWTDTERLEDAAQSDMCIRGQRLAAFRLKTQGHVWRYDADSGEWYLDPVLDGLHRPDAA